VRLTELQSQLVLGRSHTGATPKGADLELTLRVLMNAAYYMRSRVVETRGVKCMEKLDAALKAAEQALADVEAARSLTTPTSSPPRP